jgi:hypothetical protein
MLLAVVTLRTGMKISDSQLNGSRSEREKLVLTEGSLAEYRFPI